MGIAGRKEGRGRRGRRSFYGGEAEQIPLFKVRAFIGFLVSKGFVIAKITNDLGSAMAADMLQQLKLGACPDVHCRKTLLAKTATLRFCIDRGDG